MSDDHGPSYLLDLVHGLPGGEDWAANQSPSQHRKLQDVYNPGMAFPVYWRLDGKVNED